MGKQRNTIPPSIEPWSSSQAKDSLPALPQPLAGHLGGYVVLEVRKIAKAEGFGEEERRGDEGPGGEVGEGEMM
jgi:hypothetical protein